MWPRRNELPGTCRDYLLSSLGRKEEDEPLWYWLNMFYNIYDININLHKTKLSKGRLNPPQGILTFLSVWQANDLFLSLFSFHKLPFTQRATHESQTEIFFLKSKDEFWYSVLWSGDTQLENWNCLGTWMLLLFGQERERPSDLTQHSSHS